MLLNVHALGQDATDSQEEEERACQKFLALHQDATDSEEEEDRACRKFLAEHGPCFMKREAPTMPVKKEFPASRGRPFAGPSQHLPSLASSAASSFPSSQAPSSSVPAKREAIVPSKAPSRRPSTASSSAPSLSATSPGSIYGLPDTATPKEAPRPTKRALEPEAKPKCEAVAAPLRKRPHIPSSTSLPETSVEDEMSDEESSDMSDGAPLLTVGSTARSSTRRLAKPPSFPLWLFWVGNSLRLSANCDGCLRS